MYICAATSISLHAYSLLKSVGHIDELLLTEKIHENALIAIFYIVISCNLQFLFWIIPMMFQYLAIDFYIWKRDVFV